ncbi:CCA tRNA nucleotidyltransferase [Aquibacillus kalidii]|uniref:CCA tRNA nucleotidyltransferase n=1 Tax=Aquibacillus kalidii TaxID=2762597 RepID=UPI001645EE80|nr:CCA tRNA nucleotidyltransferase [Aquibacillus kalidii]
MKEVTFKEAKEILRIIENNGHQAYFVGGAVRDSLLKRPMGDIDITTSASPETVTKMFSKVIPVGIEHGTVIVRYKGYSYEITTFRSETGYSDHRHPDQITFVRNVEEDLARRDFTINAIAMDYNEKIVDPFQGRIDLSNKVIKTVGNPIERFREDPLRIMRALRFSSQLGFKMDPDTWTAIKENAAWLEKISIERIAVELQKLFAGTYTTHGMHFFINSGVQAYLPILKDHSELVIKWRDLSQPIQSWEELISLFHHYLPKVEVEEWVKSWKLSNKIKRDALHLVRAIAYYDQYQHIDEWLVYQLPRQLDASFIRMLSILTNKSLTIDKMKTIRNNLPIKDRTEIVISGSDIIGLFPMQQKGPWINKLLTMIEKKIVRGEISNEPNELGKWLMTWNPQDID